MLDLENINTWPEEHLMEGADDYDNLCTVKFAEQQRQVKAQKAQEEQRRVEEEARCKAEEEEEAA